jgi:hypothetical protein
MALVIGGILLGGSMSAIGQSDGTEPDPTEVKAAHFGGRKGPGGPGGPFPGGGLVRSESVVEGEADGTFNTIRANAGILKSVDGNTLSIEQADGENVEVTVNGDTEIRRERDEAKVGDLKAGDHVITHQVKEGDADFVTKHVMAISAERYAEMEANRKACTDDDDATVCERPERGARRIRGGDDATAPDPASAPAFFESSAA